MLVCEKALFMLDNIISWNFFWEEIIKVYIFEETKRQKIILLETIISTDLVTAGNKFLQGLYPFWYPLSAQLQNEVKHLNE